MDELLDKIAQELSEKITSKVMASVSAEMQAKFKKGIELSYTESEAAAILNMDPQTLAKKRKDGEIDYSQTIAPPNGRRHGGRIVYLPSHLLDYMKRNEVRNGKQEITLDDYLGGKVIDIFNRKKAS